jgi:Tfp pilus assembly PilM family ATPase
LDGSAKKHDLVAWEEGAITEPGESALEALPALLKRLAKEYNVPRESFGLAVESGLAAFRQLTLPLTERSKIEQVFKFEVESLLPQWSIDEVVVDFIVLDQSDESSELLAVAVPKEVLEPTLGACEKGTLEPIEVELDATAMVNAAATSGRLAEEGLRLLVNVGWNSTATVLMEGDKVRAMRAIHLGVGSCEATPAVAQSAGDGAEEEVGETEEQVAATTPEDLAMRLRQEIGRSIAGLAQGQEVTEVLVTGANLPGICGGEVMGVPVAQLAVLPEGAEVPEAERPALCAAYGVAARQLGAGPLRLSLRREELRYSGTLERLEFPLAVASLLLVTLLGVYNIFTHNETKFVKSGLSFWENSSHSLMVGNRKQGRAGSLHRPSKEIDQYVRAVRDGGDAESNAHEHMLKVRTMLRREILEMQKKLGQGVEIQHPQSALTALSGVLGVLDQSMQNNGARPSLRRVESNYQLGKRGAGDTVKVALTLSFFADNSLDATKHYEAFQTALRGQPWFVEFVDRPSTPLKGGGGIHLQGVQIVVDVSQMNSKAGA